MERSKFLLEMSRCYKGEFYKGFDAKIKTPFFTLLKGVSDVWQKVLLDQQEAGWILVLVISL